MLHRLEKSIHLHPDYRQAVNVAGQNLLLFCHDDTPYLIENRCPHMDVPLTDAHQTKSGLRCKAHGIEFTMPSGEAVGALKDVLPCLKFFPIVYDEQWICVEL